MNIIKNSFIIFEILKMSRAYTKQNLSNVQSNVCIDWPSLVDVSNKLFCVVIFEIFKKKIFTLALASNAKPYSNNNIRKLKFNLKNENIWCGLNVL